MTTKTQQNNIELIVWQRLAEKKEQEYEKGACSLETLSRARKQLETLKGR